MSFSVPNWPFKSSGYFSGGSLLAWLLDKVKRSPCVIRRGAWTDVPWEEKIPGLIIQGSMILF